MKVKTVKINIQDYCILEEMRIQLLQRTKGNNHYSKKALLGWLIRDYRKRLDGNVNV